MCVLKLEGRGGKYNTYIFEGRGVYFTLIKNGNNQPLNNLLEVVHIRFDFNLDFVPKV